MRDGKVVFYAGANAKPALELKIEDRTEAVPFHRFQDGCRVHGEMCFVATPQIPDKGEWQFRIALGNGTYAVAFGRGSFDHFQTQLQNVWVQAGEIFGYEPAPNVCDSRVVKVRRFLGRLPRRPLYIYLPRGYDQHKLRHYPVLYMHDGQNVFETYVRDSYSGSWRADESADRLIAQGLMRECIIVGVGNGGERRIAEYLPPEYTFTPPNDSAGLPMTTIRGDANHTFCYYSRDIAPFINNCFRTLTDRANTATCGSSMGGLLTTYFAWAYPDFAKHHAALSPSYWITGNPETPPAELKMVQRLRNTLPPDVRFWLDSGTRSGEHYGTDGMENTIAARDALVANGFRLGENLGYFLHEGATHSEGSWAERFPRVLQFLFPLAA